MELTVLMGHSPAKIDEKGRLKVPADFRRIIEERHGSDCFITSTDGKRALVYPLPVWFDILARLDKVPSSNKAKSKYLDIVNRYGQTGTIDAQGRLLVPSILRDKGIADDVLVLGKGDHLAVENGEEMQKRIDEAPLTDEDLKELELHGV